MTGAIVIDAGHGGEIDPGTEAGGVVEKDLTLIYANALAGELCRFSVPVIQTRTEDQVPGGGKIADGLRERVRIANDANARAFVSVHFNGSTNTEAKGTWILYAAGADGGRSLAIDVSRLLGAEVYPDHSGWTGQRRLYVLRRTRMPAIIIEFGFLTNASERARLQNVEYMGMLVHLTARGILDWLSK
jgi:N-acetylmuramoyl-L-alanine amidase